LLLAESRKANPDFLTTPHLHVRLKGEMLQNPGNGLHMRRIDLTKKMLAALLLAVTASAFAQVDPNKTVVIVNGEEIKGAEYYRRMEFLPGVGKKDGETFFEAPPGFLTLEQLITEKLVMQLAKQKGILPVDAEVENELKIRMEDNPKLLTEWASMGRAPEELKTLVRYELAQFKIQTFGITVTDQEVEKFYKDNPTIYSLPKRAKLRVIVVESEADRSAVDKDLAAGKAFAEVAKERSLDLSKLKGGDYGEVPYEFLNTPARTEVEATKIGGVTNWVSSQTPSGNTRYVKFQVVDVLPEKRLDLDVKLKRNIRRKMMLDRGRVKNDVRQEMSAMRSKATIDIKEPQFADTYKKFVDTYLKQGG
jgi:foldase protein PrsA